MDLPSVTGVKPGSLNPLRAAGPKLAVGERLSPCGKFAINGAGQWRELTTAEQVPQVPEFGAVGPDGKAMANPPR
ncbi:hypothetical protein HYH03_006984 [Edaphochlamys debaryana]|uniref:Uncharacterized protein n=1 Tax=Edaphochlamys debaryana TaxID=47281 RepID=A0A835Y3X8_9CHLO|nr:hypothetical protein HYH03_006984 [Edaphochlamys debaryana]|eukprot:KAG2494737.1 hypothetical protein HYH03_006984 [Edaphochlamys debaryana]